MVMVDVEDNVFVARPIKKESQKPCIHRSEVGFHSVFAFAPAPGEIFLLIKKKRCTSHQCVIILLCVLGTVFFAGVAVVAFCVTFDGRSGGRHTQFLTLSADEQRRAADD